MNKVDIIIFKNLIFLDKPFTYLSHEEIENGSFVVVDFNNSLEIGLVISSSKVEGQNPQNLKTIKELIKEIDPISDKYIKLALWMKKFYVTTYAKAFSTVADLTKIDKLRYSYEAISEDEDIIDFVDRINKSIKSTDKKRLRDLIEEGKIKENVSYNIINAKEEAYYKFNMDIGQGLKTIRSNASRQLALILEIYDILEAKEVFSQRDLTSLKNYNKNTFDQLIERGIFSKVSEDQIKIPTKEIPLSPQQEDICEKILESDSNKFLIHGVTGSGKTEIYFKLMEETLEKGGSCLFLLPEISLTPQMENRVKSRFGNNVSIIHSKLSKSKRIGQLERIKEGKSKILLGTRSAVFTQMPNLKLVIIDEEHDKSYQLDENNKYDAREVGRFLIESSSGAKLVLGSATPSIDTYYKAKHGVYELHTINTRPLNTPMPKVIVADMRQELKKGNTSPFSMDLMAQIKSSINRGKQVILFLNRRGYAPFVSCRDCGQPIICDKCDISMVYHKKANYLKCHYCGQIKPMPRTCPSCSSHKIRQFGLGTEQLEEMTREIYPDLKILRIDSDTSSNIKDYEDNIKLIESKQVDIIIGTQMISKGLDFSGVDTVGVIAADLSLNMPDFTAQEDTFQILTQVAGRAGRDKDQGKVVIQSYNPDHFSIQYSKDHDYINFYNEELRLRRAFLYPPFARLYTLSIKARDLRKNTKISQEIYKGLENILKDYDLKDQVNFISHPDRLMTIKINNNYTTDLIFSSSIRDERLVKDAIYQLIFGNIYKLNLQDTHVDLTYK